MANVKKGVRDRNENEATLFPTDLPSKEWMQFRADGFSRPVCGVLYRTEDRVGCGMALGGIDTGCLDLETSGLLGYCTIFNSHLPRRGPINLPILGMSVNGQTWVLSTRKTKQYEATGRALAFELVEPVFTDLVLDGVQTVKEIHYWGHYPVADMEFETDAPISVGLRAWSPFLPGDLESSMIPGIVFEVRLRNTTLVEHKGTIAFSFPGPTEKEAGTNKFLRKEVKGKFNGVSVTTEKASYALGVIGKENLRLGGELGADGKAWVNIANRLPEVVKNQPGASVAIDFSLPQGEEKVVRFILTWYSPEWKGAGHPSATGMKPRWFLEYVPGFCNTFTHMYALYHPDAVKTAQTLARKHKGLLRRILAWQEVIYTEESLPVWLRDSLVNVLYMITECGLWAQAKPPLPEWVKRKDGLFGMNESPRTCPNIECIGCSFYGNQPLVYFFPELALSTLRGYKGYSCADGMAVWDGSYYLNFWEPETGKKSEFVFGYQLDGEWITNHLGLPGVFHSDRVKTTLKTIKRCNIGLSKTGAVNYANPDGTIANPGGYGTYSYFVPEALMLAMTYMDAGEKEFGLELAYKVWHNLVCIQGYTWDMGQCMRGDVDTGERQPVGGFDYYQNMMLWSLPAAIKGQDFSGPVKSGGLVYRIIQAAR